MEEEINEVEINGEQYVERVCDQHFLPFVVYCKPCDRPLCGDCLSEHKNHNYLTIQEIEKEVLGRLQQSYQRGEAHFQSLREQKERLLKRVRDIRAVQEERAQAIKLYMLNVEKLAYGKHKELVAEEEEMVGKLIPLSFRVEKQAVCVKNEIGKCSAQLNELQGLKQPERNWKAFQLMSQRKAYSFEEDQSVQQQQQQSDVLLQGHNFVIPLGVLFDQLPQLDAINLDAKKAALKTEKVILKDSVRKLTGELQDLQEKYKELRKKLETVKGT